MQKSQQHIHGIPSVCCPGLWLSGLCVVPHLISFSFSHQIVFAAGAEELEKRLLLMQKEQKLIQEEAQQAVLQAAASQPAAMAGATVGQPSADSFPAAAPQVGLGFWGLLGFVTVILW